MKLIKILFVVTSLTISLALIEGCETLKQYSQAMADLKKLEFKLEDVENFSLAGINLSNKKSVSDLSMMDGVKLGKAFKDNKFPADFVLNVAARNPNDGSGATQSTNAKITNFDWKLYIDDVETIHGNINRTIMIPGSGQKEIIPLSISLDLYDYFSNKGYDGLLNLAMAVGGVKGSAARLKLDAKPTVSTGLGAITYPGRITIVDKQFSAQ